MLDIRACEAFMRNLVIRHLNTGLPVPFVPNHNQRKSHRLYEEQLRSGRPLRVICVKSRRTGFSSDAVALAMCHAIGFPGSHGMITAHHGETAEGLFNLPKQWTKTLPFNLPKPTERLVRVPHAGNESTLSWATVGNIIFGRGLTHSFLLVSEAAYIDQPSYMSVINTVSDFDPNSIVMIEGTANGQSGIGETFYDFWQDAYQGKSNYIAVFLTWLEDPDCIGDPELAEDAPRTDMEKELMKDFHATKAQISWVRSILYSPKCGGLEDVFRQEFPWCISEGSRISTAAGIIPIESSEIGDVTESGLISNVWPKGERKTVRVTTQLGYSLTCTSEHLLMGTEGQTIPAAESLGERVELRPPRFAACEYVASWPMVAGAWISLPVTSGFARFLGYFVGDGSVSHSKRSGGQISIACDGKDQDVVSDVQELLRQFFPGKCERRVLGSKKGGVVLRVSSVKFVEVLKQLGLWSENKPHRRVCVPECIWRSPKHIVKEFLKSLFEADGFNAYQSPKVSLFSKHVLFLGDVQLLLLGFGITARLSSRPAINGYGFKYVENTLTLRGSEARKFRHEIGFVGTRKSGRSNWPPLKKGRPNTEIVLEDQVSKIEPGPSVPVWDICIPERETFSANGIAVHNCPGVAFLVSGDPAFETSELKLARSTLLKPLAIGMLSWDGDQVRFGAARDGWHVWEWPDPKCHYYIGGDAARGTKEGDFAAAVVWNGTTGNQAGRFAQRIDPEALADELARAGNFWRAGMSPGKLNVELTGNLGLHTQRVLRDRYHYSNLYGWAGARNDRPPQRKYGLTSLGWETSFRSRERMLVSYRSDLAGARLTVRDEALLSQMESAQRTAGMSTWNFEVKRGHDDIFMAALISWIACCDYPPPRIDMKSVKPADETDADRLRKYYDVEENSFGFVNLARQHELAFQKRVRQSKEMLQ